MFMPKSTLATLVLLSTSFIHPYVTADTLPVKVGPFNQQAHKVYTSLEELPNPTITQSFNTPLPWYPSLASVVDSQKSVRDVAQLGTEIAIAAKNGLYIGDGTTWKLVLPSQGSARWAPFDVRAVDYD